MTYMRYLTGLLLVFAGAATVSPAVILQVDANVAIESLPGNSLLKHPRDLMRQYAQEMPSDPALAVGALNYDVAIENGFQFSYPVSFVVDLGEGLRIDRYRADFAEPVVMLMDPSFSPDNPLIEFRNEVVIIETVAKRYVARSDIKDGTKAEWLNPSLKEAKFRSIEVVELWTDALNVYRDLLAGNRTANLRTAEFERYDLPQGTVILSSDHKSMDYFAGPSDSPDVYGRLQLQSYQDHLFPSLLQEWSKDQNISMYFTVTRSVDEVEAAALFEIPEKK